MRLFDGIQSAGAPQQSSFWLWACRLGDACPPGGARWLAREAFVVAGQLDFDTANEIRIPAATPVEHSRSRART